MKRKFLSAWILPLALAGLTLGTLAGCGKDHDIPTDPNRPTPTPVPVPTPTPTPVPTPTPGSGLTRADYPVSGSWAYYATVTTSSANPSTAHSLWYYSVTSTSQQGGTSYYSLHVIGSPNSDMNTHDETWKVSDSGIVFDNGGVAQTGVPFPLTVGTTWTSDNAYEFGHAGLTTFNCVGLESLTTQRGALNAYKVSLSQNLASGNTASGYLWFAPGVGLVKADTTQTWWSTGVTRRTELQIAPTSTNPNNFSRFDFPIFSNWQYNLTVTNTPYGGYPSSSNVIWYYALNSFSQQGNDRYYSIHVTGSAGSDMNTHDETWRTMDTGLITAYGESVQTWLVAFPLQPGTSWNGQNTWELGHNGDATFTYAGTESITTGRGSFFTYKVTINQSLPHWYSGQLVYDTTQGTLWLAPGWGIVHANATKYWGDTGYTQQTQLELG